MSNGYGRSTDGFGINRQQSVELIVKTALENGVNDPKQIAYMLATAQHETRNFTAPDEDFGRQQAKKLGYRGGEEYFGRGYVHLTHIDNYQKFDKLLGLNGELVKNPALAKDPEIAAKILVVGMRDGLFTGKKLESYVDHDTHDLYNARRVVNGVIPSKPWSINAAKDCERYAEAWEKQIDGLINQVKKNGVDLNAGKHTKLDDIQYSKGAKNPLSDGVLKRGEGGEVVVQFQKQLNALGYVGANGKPLDTSVAHFGPNTEHAVKEFQKAHGLTPVDGKIGKDTIAALNEAKQHPLVSETTHPNHALYAAVAKQLPPGTKSEAIANVTLQAMENGMTDASKIGKVSVKDGDAFVMPAGSFGGHWIKVDLSAPTGSLKAMSDHMAGETKELQQQRHTAQPVEQNKPGPVMV